MSIEKITSAIIDEAQTECEQTMNPAKAQSRGSIKTLEERIVIETDVAVKAAEEEREKIISRRRSVADIDSKKIILRKKQELIRECFAQAIDYIVSMEEDRYVSFLAAAGKGSGLKEGMLIFNEKERKSIGQKVVDALNREVDGGNYVLSDETRNLKGGYMLQKGQVYINNSVEAMVEDKSRELTGDVAGILFPAEE